MKKIILMLLLIFLISVIAVTSVDTRLMNTMCFSNVEGHFAECVDSDAFPYRFGIGTPSSLMIKNTVSVTTTPTQPLTYSYAVIPSESMNVPTRYIPTGYLEFFFKPQENYDAKFYLLTKYNSGPKTTVTSYTNIAYNIKDYIVATPKLNDWNHVKIPISSRPIVGIGFGVKKSYHNNLNFQFKKVYLDNSMWCSDATYDDANPKSRWISDLDSNIKDIINKPIGKSACNINYVWTGTQCCGDDAQKNSEETFADNNTGCLFSEPALNNERYMQIRYNTATQNYNQTCTRDTCFYPDPTYSSKQKTYFKDNDVLTLERYNLVSQKSTGNINSEGMVTSGNLLKATNIPLQILYQNDSFKLCNAVDYVKQSLSGLYKDSDYCEVTNKYFCSPTYNGKLSEWSNETSNNVPANQRDIFQNLTSLKQDFFINQSKEYFNNLSCCPSTHCWNGYMCANSVIDVISKQKYNTNKEAFTKPFGYQQDGFDQYICYRKNASQTSTWTESYYKLSWDNSTQGYCDSDTECYYSDEVGCVDNGFYEKDHYCEQGNWTSRTKLIALQLLNLTLTYSPDNYVVFCDNYNLTLNNYLTLNLSNAIPYIEQSNNYCTAIFSKNDKQITAVGTSLNTNLTSYLPVFNITNCRDEALTSEQYVNCAVDQKLWFNNKTKSLIYIKEGAILQPNSFSELFVNFFLHPIYTISEIMNRFLTKSYDVATDSSEYEFIKQTKDFNRIYLSRIGTKTIFGANENLYKNEYLTVNYNNFTIDICKRMPENVKCQPIINLNVNIPSYQVFTDKMQNIWRALSSQLRVVDQTKSGSLPPANILKPEHDDVFIYGLTDLDLQAQYDDNIQSYYWSLNSSGSKITAQFQGLDLKKPVNKLFTGNGPRNISLITIGFNGRYNISTQQICIGQLFNGKVEGCDPDIDNDGFFYGVDNCPKIFNDQNDTDDDSGYDKCDYSLDTYSGLNNFCGGDACDHDIDNDGIENILPAPKYYPNSEGYDFFPYNNTESLDNDLDTLGNNIDPDDDNDGITDINETLTDSLNPDTDGDKLLDGYSLTVLNNSYTAKYLKSKSILNSVNGNQITFFGELSLGTDPTNKDTDGDGLTDNYEFILGINMTNKDTDFDGVNDFDEVNYDGQISYTSEDLNVTNNDTDGDGMTDGWELSYKDITNPTNDKFDPKNPVDASLNFDEYLGDTLTNLEEFQKQTNPFDEDTDNDGLKDQDDPNPLELLRPKIIFVSPAQNSIVGRHISLIINTTKESNCHWSFSPLDYNETTEFEQTNTLQHKVNDIELLTEGDTKIYIDCKDEYNISLNNTFVLNLTADIEPPQFLNINPNIATNYLQEFKVNLNENAKCVYSNKTDISFEDYLGNLTKINDYNYSYVFNVTNTINHFKNLCLTTPNYASCTLFAKQFPYQISDTNYEDLVSNACNGSLICKNEYNLIASVVYNSQAYCNEINGNELSNVCNALYEGVDWKTKYSTCDNRGCCNGDINDPYNDDCCGLSYCDGYYNLSIAIKNHQQSECNTLPFEHKQKCLSYFSQDEGACFQQYCSFFYDEDIKTSILCKDSYNNENYKLHKFKISTSLK